MTWGFAGAVGRVVLSAALACAVEALPRIPSAGAAQDVSTRPVALTLTEGTSMAATISPDRRWIAIDLVGSLWVLPARGGEATRITPDLIEAREPTWSPDNHSLAFQGFDDGAWHIYVTSREGGEPRALTSGLFDDRDPAWSHDGARIAFSSDRWGGITTIWEVSPAGGDPRQISKRDAWMPTWSPNDQEVTVVSGDLTDSAGTPVAERDRRPGLWGLGAHERLLFSAKGLPMPAAADWSPDGRELAVTTEAGTLSVNGQRVNPGADVFPFRPQWLSRAELLYTADGHIVRARPPQEHAEIVPFAAHLSLERATYTVVHRPIEPAGPQPLKGIVAPVVSPDGRAIAFIAMGDLWVLPIGGTPVRITDDPAVELDPAWSPDGTELAFSSDRGGHMDLWIHNFRTNIDAQVTHERRGAVSGAAFSPDGSHIAFLIDRRDLVALRLKAGDCQDGSVTTILANELGRPTWAPDCKSVAVGALLPYSNRYRGGLNQLLIYSFEFRSWAESLLFQQHSAGNREDTGPVWSPSGYQMAFVSEGRLWTVNVDGRGAATGQPAPIADDQPEAPSWEGDSRHIVYQTPHGLRRILADGSAPEPIALDLAWQPSPAPTRIVVHAGRVLDGTIDGLRGESDIVVEGGVIRSIESHRDELHVGSVVDASNELVMPGLIEMHAHLDRDYGENFGRAWLAYGITSLRLPAVNPYAGLEMREAFDAGRRPGPHVFMAGDPFDGARVYAPGGVSITSDAQLDQELDRATVLGVDFFKTYARLPDRLQKRAVDFAHAQGKPVTSHEIFPAVADGVDGVEHLRPTSRRGYSSKVSATNHLYMDVVDLLAKSGMTLTPIIGIEGGFEARTRADRTLLFDRRLGLYPLRVVDRLTALATDRPAPELDARIKPLETGLKAIFTAGGRILAGTDAPIDPYGLSLHVELEEYVHAGLTPFQAIQTATINAAQALGVDRELGTIEAGKVADLAFLGSDPLADIRNTRDIRRVMKGGRMFTVEELTNHAP